MIKGIIFDFNRTLYLPEIEVIPQETLDLLKNLKDKGFMLALISIKEGERDKLIEKYNLSSFFSIIKLVDEKDKEVFEETLKSLKLDCSEVIVIGDRIRSEIKIANKLKIKTIWYRNGKFSEEYPICEEEYPNWTIDNLLEIVKILNISKEETIKYCLYDNKEGKST
ncbi:MAG: HAD hydrolase-like protein [Nanoarchaeota archaeon]|nr:HAD hydrolase-like protein [Nanoarchaeota archaeon]